VTVWWHRADAGQLPPDDDWLCDRERRLLTALSVAKRRADWRLGRWTAKHLVASVLGLGDRVELARIEIRAAADGAPEPYLDGAVVDLSLSISHRDGVAVAAACRRPAAVGIDIETIEPRSDAFVREWLSDAERATLPRTGPDRDLRVMCHWSAKEASAKALREGLRLDVRRAAVEAGAGAGDWAPIAVTWGTERMAHRGWWRRDGRLVIAVVSDPPAGPPQPTQRFV
jgi:4'-phosphopantetheinyl transferase